MFKKIVLLLLLGTLPMFACGPSVSAEDLMVFFITIIGGVVLATYAILFLFRKNNKKEEV